MNSCERLLTALSCRQPDRVPISTYELCGFESRRFENTEPSYARLMDVVRAQTDCVCMWEMKTNEVFAGSAYPVPIDRDSWREGDAVITRQTVHAPAGDLTSVFKVIDNMQTVWSVEPWCKNTADVDTALSVPFVPIEADAGDYARVAGEVGDRGIIMSSLSDPLLDAANFMEFGDFMVWAMTETDHFAATVAEMHRRKLANLRQLLEAQPVDLYRICGPEYAVPPCLPPSFFERFVVPQVGEMVDLMHAHGARARLHCHGRIAGVLEMIRATGADALDPCEAPPEGDISLAEVKARIGRQMCIFGNLQLRLLESGSVEQVVEAVRQCLREAMAGGGYVIMPTAGPITVPLARRTQDNYLAFIETARQYGVY